MSHYDDDDEENETTTTTKPPQASGGDESTQLPTPKADEPAAAESEMETSSESEINRKRRCWSDDDDDDDDLFAAKPKPVLYSSVGPTYIRPPTYNLGRRQPQRVNKPSTFAPIIIESRDGNSKMLGSVMYASGDQMNAGGFGACSAIASLNAHWFLSNPNTRPSRAHLDNQILVGTSIWIGLCKRPELQYAFPDRHFDLETVLANLPISCCCSRSYTGFFSTDKFEQLADMMSVDKIWEGINKDLAEDEAEAERVYIVGWNDHFFTLKAEREAFYLVDSFGPKLSPECNNGFALRFDSGSVMLGGLGNDRSVPICQGKDCCREFLKRFLAVEIVAKLEENVNQNIHELYQRLQIDFHYIYLDRRGPPPSSFSSGGSQVVPPTATVAGISSEGLPVLSPNPPVQGIVPERSPALPSSAVVSGTSSTEPPVLSLSLSGELSASPSTTSMQGISYGGSPTLTSIASEQRIPPGESSVLLLTASKPGIPDSSSFRSSKSGISDSLSSTRTSNDDDDEYYYFETSDDYDSDDHRDSDGAEETESE